MKFTAGNTNAIRNELYEQLMSYRYEVFVARLGWELKTEIGWEADEFDHRDTQYVIAQDELGRITGCARLLPTSKPYLLEKIFPELMQDQPLPKSNAVWELSRFTSLNPHETQAQTPNQFSSETAIELLRECIQVAWQHGARHMITVSPLAIERLLRRAGFTSQRAAPPKVIGGYPLVPCWLDLQLNLQSRSE